MSRDLNLLHSVFRPKVDLFLQDIKDAKIDLIVTCTYRSFAEQNALFEQGRSKPGPIVTNAQGGQSAHNYGLAIDCGVFRGGKYLDSDEPKTASAFHKKAGQLAASYGLTWGGTFKNIVDEPHFELSHGLPILTLLDKHNRGEDIL